MDQEKIPRSIDILVALGSVSQDVSAANDRGKETASNVTTKNVLDERTARILDGIACVLVSEPKEQIFAVGAQLIPPRKKRRRATVKLFLASNADVSDATIEYLRIVWQMLRRIAKEKRYELAKAAVSKPNIPALLKPAKRGWSKDESELIRLGHQHCFKRWRRSLDKRYSEMLDYGKVLKDRIRNLPHDHPAREYFVILAQLVVQVMHFHKVIDDCENRGLDPVSIVDAGDFVAKISEVSLCFRRLEGLGWGIIDGWHGTLGILLVPCINTLKDILGRP